MTEPVRVVVADDDVLLREGVIRLLIEESFEVVGATSDAEGLHRLVESTDPDLAVVDIRMPPTRTVEGLEAAVELRRTRPTMGVMLLSMHVESRCLERLLGANANGVGYLLKHRVTDLARFTADLRVVARGGSVIDPEIITALVGRRAREGDDGLAALTDRECEVLGLMAEGRSNPAIAERLFLNQKTVESHVRSIFTRLGLGPVAGHDRRVLAVLRYLQGDRRPG